MHHGHSLRVGSLQSFRVEATLHQSHVLRRGPRGVVSSRLIERGLPTIEPGQEDWGWYIESRLGDSSCIIDIGGNRDDSSANPDHGEWRIMVETKRSLADRMRR